MNIKYTLSFPAPHTHYAEIEMHISNMETNELDLKMAVWTPGSYLIREFQKNIDLVEWSTDNGQWLRADKTDKNTWKIIVQNHQEIIVRYKTYCFEYSVRTNFVDESHALINGAPTFLYVDGNESSAVEVEIIPLKTGKISLLRYRKRSTTNGFVWHKTWMNLLTHPLKLAIMLLIFLRLPTFLMNWPCTDTAIAT